MSNYARGLVGPLIVLTAWGTARADKPSVYAELCVDCRVLDEAGRSKIVSHRLKLTPDELSSLAFQVEAVGDKRVRLAVKRQGEGPSGFASVEVVSKVHGEEETRATVVGGGDKPLEVTSERVTVYYDRPGTYRWWLLASVKGCEDGRFLAILPGHGEGKEVQATRFSARFKEHQEKVSVALSGVTQ